MVSADQDPAGKTNLGPWRTTSANDRSIAEAAACSVSTDADLNTKGWIPDERELDRGANSVVHLARRDGDVAVLKVCAAWRPESERYMRFVAEIQALEELSDEPGVMQIIDSDVPDPGRGQFPWYVMPQGV